MLARGDGTLATATGCPLMPPAYRAFSSSQERPRPRSRRPQQSDQIVRKGGVMRSTLLALALAAIPGVAFAQPPVAGTTHTFYDPVFTGTVFCDTLDQVRDIATADTPSEVYLAYLQTANA